MRRRSAYPVRPKATKPVFVLLCLAAWCVWQVARLGEARLREQSGSQVQPSNRRSSR